MSYFYFLRHKQPQRPNNITKTASARNAQYLYCKKRLIRTFVFKTSFLLTSVDGATGVIEGKDSFGEATEGIVTLKPEIKFI